MEQINYEPYLRGQKPPEDMIAWALQNGAMKKHYLIYGHTWATDPLEESKYKAVKVICSRCGKHFIARRVDAGGCTRSYPPAPFGWHNFSVGEAVISGMDTLCPCCGEAAETVHIGKFRHTIDDFAYITQAVRLPVPGVKDRLALLEWQLERRIDKQGCTSYLTWLWSAWVVEEKKVVRLKGWQRCLSTLTYIPISQRKTFLDDYETMQMMYPFTEANLLGTTAENCKLDRYINQGGLHLVAYLALWRKRPAVENLVMQQLGNLVEEMIDNEQKRSSYARHYGIPKLPQVDWKEKKPHRMLHLSKEEFQKYKKEISNQDMLKIGKVRRAGIADPLDVLLAFLRQRTEYELDKILEENQPGQFLKIAQYLDRQKECYVTLRDYWRMAADVKLDLENPQIRWPRNLKQDHDRAVKLYNKRKDEILQHHFTARTQQLDPLSWRCDGLLIRPCATEAEMRNEGKSLHHCVARYAKDHAEGRTAIMLIRREEAPDKPFFTLEWDEKHQKVVQNRGKYNCARLPEVQAFEEKWVAWVLETHKTENRRKTA